MYLEIFPADFAVFRVFLGISRDFAEIPEFRGSPTARNIRSPDYIILVYTVSDLSILSNLIGLLFWTTTLHIHRTHLVSSFSAG